MLYMIMLDKLSGYPLFNILWYLFFSFSGRQKQTDDFNKFHGILRFVDIFLRICFFFIHLIFKLTVEIWFLLIHPIFELIVKIFMGIWFFLIHRIFELIMSMPILNIPIVNTVFAVVYLTSTTTIPMLYFSWYFPTLSATLIVIVLLHIFVENIKHCHLCLYRV